jgi:prophage tail gpP-like protein
MAKPTPGKQYTIVSGDTLSGIALQAYGRGSKYPIIWKANQTTLKSDDPDLIYPGEVIIIPLLEELKELRNAEIETIFEGDGPEKARLIINDYEIPVKDFNIIRTMDTAADGWNAEIAWNPGEDENLDAAVKPYGYQDYLFYLGGKLKTAGALYKSAPSFSSSGRTKNLEGWSYTADVIDSTIKPPYEVKNTTLKQRANELVAPFGISVVWELEDDFKFDKMTASATDTVFAHLLKYAKQKGVLISSTNTGDLLFVKANIDGESVGTVEEGTSQGFLEYGADFDGRKRFNSYKAIGQSPKKKDKFAIAKDDNVPKSRMLTFKADDTTTGDIKKAAEWKRSSQVAEALTLGFNATSWYGPNGLQWEENTILTVVSKTLSVEKGFDFLITRVNFKQSNSGKTAQLSIVPPQTFTGDPIPDIFA